MFCIIGLEAIWRSYCREVCGLWVYFSPYFRVEVVRLLDSAILIIYGRMHHSDAEAGGFPPFPKKIVQFYENPVFFMTFIKKTKKYLIKIIFSNELFVFLHTT